MSSIVNNKFSPTNCHQPIVINQLPSTNCHQPIVINKSIVFSRGSDVRPGAPPPCRCDLLRVWCSKQCVLQGFVGVEDPKCGQWRNAQTVGFTRVVSVMRAARTRITSERVIFEDLFLKNMALNQLSSINCHTNHLPPTNCHQPPMQPMQAFSLAKLLTCGVIRFYNFISD